jgi:hypothetical protein
MAPYVRDPVYRCAVNGCRCGVGVGWGVPPTQVAEWAGHSVEILLKIYAKCLAGGGEVLRQRMQAALGHRTG